MESYIAPKHLSITVNPENILDGVKRIISEVRPNWNLGDIKFKVFTEGISNQLMGCFYPSELGILVRIYGIGTELFIDRNSEQRTMLMLSKAGLGSDLIASFSNGIVYHFVPGNILTVDTVSNSTLWPLVARQLGAMHRLPVDGNAILWSRLQNFLNLLPSDFTSNPIFHKVVFPFSNKKSLCNEVQWLQSKLEVSSSPVVFAHNDLLLANVVLNDEKTKATFIDYEYSGTNYQAYDIANHFNEYAGVDEVDYSKLPNLEYQREWLGEYLKIFYGTQVTDDLIENTLGQVQQFMTVSHMFWGLWSVVQAIHSKIDFDFPEYACVRLRKYIEIKSILE